MGLPWMLNEVSRTPARSGERRELREKVMGVGSVFARHHLRAHREVVRMQRGAHVRAGKVGGLEPDHHVWGRHLDDTGNVPVNPLGEDRWGERHPEVAVLHLFVDDADVVGVARACEDRQFLLAIG